jgi:3-dehydroquinate synthase
VKEIGVKLNNSLYNVYIGTDLYSRIPYYLKGNMFTRLAVVMTNPVVQAFYSKSIEKALMDAGFNPEFLVLPDGEAQKSLPSASKVYRILSNLGAERRTPIFALGGGVMGDLAGFVAATYMRGIPLIHLPTTLLAQVDSSIGGKTAVDLGKLKNQIGVFYQPSLVVSDIGSLRSLPRNEMSNGLAEVIKYAMIQDRQFFKYLETNVKKIMAKDETTLEEMIFKCVEIKANIIQQDVNDTGIRNILNFGHTAGHAIESASDFSVSHGQAVALGMIVACKISLSMGRFNKGDLQRLMEILKRYDLFKGMPAISQKKFAAAIRRDKKIVNGKMRFVLPEAIGKVFVSDDIDVSEVNRLVGDWND